MNLRPSGRELFRKVEEARTALSEGRIQFPLTKSLVADLDALGLEDEDELVERLADALREIRAVGPEACYAGDRPPARSYEPEILNQELWAFSWESDYWRCHMYLKFALKKGIYIHVSFHDD